MKSQSVFKIFTFYFLLFTLIGCEAFVRKFTRKPKKEELPQEELVLAPQEYLAPETAKEELYRQYFIFWKSWQDELLEAIQNKNQKKQIECAKESINNLVNLRSLLVESSQKKLDNYIAQLEGLLADIRRDYYGNNYSGNLQSTQRIKRNILRDFAYSKHKDYLK